MNEFQLDLLVEQARTVQELPEPTMSYSDCILNFLKYQQEVRHGLGSFDDDDEPKLATFTRCFLPLSANITHIVKEYGRDTEMNFLFYGLESHNSSGELINWWLEQKDYKNGGLNKDNIAGKWILANAAEMNNSRRIWDARRKHNDVSNVKHQIEQLQERLRVEQLTLSIKVIEAAEDRNFTIEEKRVKLKELGAQDKDL